MEKFQFTKEGVQSLKDVLYVLPNAELQAHVALIQVNFKGWMKTYFNLSENQKNFLNGMDDQMIAILSSQTSLAIANRLPITLKKQEENISVSNSKKIIRAESKMEALYETGSGYEVEGELEIIIEYVE